VIGNKINHIATANKEDSQISSFIGQLVKD